MGRFAVVVTMRRRSVAAALLCVVTLWAAPARSVGPSAVSSGVILPPGDDDRGTRERVSLHDSGNVLIGRPRQSRVELIALYAPDAPAGDVIVRERQHENGTTSVLISAPPSLSSRVRRVSLFIRNSSADLRLLEEAGGQWLTRRPQGLQVSTARDSSSSQGLLAFRPAGLGLYWLVEESSPHPGAERVSPSPFADATVAGDASRAVLPALLSGLLLGLGWAVSRYVHDLQRRREH